MAFFALEEALQVGSKFLFPLLADAMFTSTVAGTSLSSGRSNVPVQTNPGSAPTATPGSTDSNLENRLNDAGIDPGVITGIANAPLIPPPPPNEGTAAPFRPTREYFEAKNADIGVTGLTAQQTDTLFRNELDSMAAFFQTTPQSVASVAELASLASNAVTGGGPVFTYWYGQRVARDMTFIMKAEQSIADLAVQSVPISAALNQARSDYELKIGGPISFDRFIQSLGARGVSAPRIERAWNRINGSRGDNQSTRAVFRRWVTDRLLPGAAGSAVTFLLERVMQSAVPQESNNRSVDAKDAYAPPDWELARNDLLSQELRDVFSSINLGDEASGIIGSQSWNSRLSPLPGSVQWTANPTQWSGLNDDSPLPYRVPAAGPDMITYPGDTIYNHDLQGDTLSEKLNDNRAAPGNNALALPTPTLPTRTNVAPYLYVPDFNSRSRWPRNMRPASPFFPAIHETVRGTDHLVSQTYDSTMVANLPSFVTPVTSSAGNLYGRDQRAYRVPLDSAPNIVGAGFDVEDTERRLVENVAMQDDTASQPPPAAYFGNDQQTMAQRTKEVPYVPPGMQRNPVFMNVGAQQPVAPIQSLPGSRPL